MEKHYKSHTKKIWIDLDNSPHVLFFRPIIIELEKQGYSVVTTARDAFQVKGLLSSLNVTAKIIGKHHGKHKFIKIIGLFIRAIELLPYIKNEKPFLAISHGSRSQMILAKILNITSVLIMDYEHVQLIPFAYPDWIFVPEIVPGNNLLSKCKHLKKYPGIKEDVYIPDFIPDSSILSDLNIKKNKSLLVTVRPPATEAHYHNPESEILFEEVMNFLLNHSEEINIVVLPRNIIQANEIQKKWKEIYQSRKIIIPEKAIDGLNLIWHSDLVISGGGTMNREAATLGVPVYSIFRGKLGAIDKYLSEKKKLVLLTNKADIEKMIKLIHRDKTESFKEEKRRSLSFIIDNCNKIYNDITK